MPEITPRYDSSRLKSVGIDVFISERVEIRRPHLVSIGNHVAIDSGFYISTAADIGNYIHIGPYVCVIGGAEAYFKMGDFTTIALGAKLLCGSDRFLGDGLISAPGIDPEYTRVKREPIVLEDFANVGANAVIFPGLTLAQGSVLGALSVLKENTEPWTIYAGSPARPIKKRPKDQMLSYARKLGYGKNSDL